MPISRQCCEVAKKCRDQVRSRLSAIESIARRRLSGIYAPPDGRAGAGAAPGGPQNASAQPGPGEQVGRMVPPERPGPAFFRPQLARGTNPSRARPQRSSVGLERAVDTHDRTAMSSSETETAETTQANGARITTNRPRTRLIRVSATSSSKTRLPPRRHRHGLQRSSHRWVRSKQRLCAVPATSLASQRERFPKQRHTACLEHRSCPGAFLPPHAEALG